MAAKPLNLLALKSRDPAALQALGPVPDQFIIISERVTTRSGQNALPDAPEWAIRELVKFAGGDGLYTLSAAPNTGGYSGVNPWRRETFNLTRQIQIGKESPDLARELAREAAGATK